MTTRQPFGLSSMPVAFEKVYKDKEGIDDEFHTPPLDSFEFERSVDSIGVAMGLERDQPGPSGLGKGLQNGKTSASTDTQPDMSTRPTLPPQSIPSDTSGQYIQRRPVEIGDTPPLSRDSIYSNDEIGIIDLYSKSPESGMTSQGSSSVPASRETNNLTEAPALETLQAIPVANLKIETNPKTPDLQKLPYNHDAPGSAVSVASSYKESRREAGRVRSTIDMRSKPSSRTNTIEDGPRDRYGFLKATSYIRMNDYDKWWSKYQPYLQRRKKKWVTLMKQSGLDIGAAEDKGKDSNEARVPSTGPTRFPPKSEKLKRYVRKGIPAEWRGQAWFWFARGYEYLNSNVGVYDQLCEKSATMENVDAELIERDLYRTFPDNVYFRKSEGEADETPMIMALRRVLRAFALHHPKVGYCQSLNFLAGLLLLFMDEERAFWMLHIITQKYLPGVHDTNLEGVNVDQGVLMLLVQKSLPAVWRHIGVGLEGAPSEGMDLVRNLPPITLCTASWFMSVYIGTLPIETTLRIWDCLFYEGSKTLFRIALTLMKQSEPEFMGLNDPMEIFQVVQTSPKSMLDASHLMESCFKRYNDFGHISQDEIAQLRKIVRQKRGDGGTGGIQSRDDVLEELILSRQRPTSRTFVLRKLHIGSNKWSME
ncbi:GTPase-activating protein [Yarrowia sp. C11]|nr:GTPase-activating protein [Yarrowia sp. E02]KAG5372395.1 GTPase-activating protein [Yarrowia sp. C11]